MSNKQSTVSNAFQTFMQEAPDHAQAWRQLVGSLSRSNVLDEKTGALVYIAILAVLGLHSGIAFHVQEAKKLGVSREELISAILLGLPACGNKVVLALPIALDVFDKE